MILLSSLQRVGRDGYARREGWLEVEGGDRWRGGLFYFERSGGRRESRVSKFQVIKVFWWNIFWQLDLRRKLIHIQFNGSLLFR